MSRWFRFYEDVMDDPKVQLLSDAHYRAWTALLCIASKNDGEISGDFAVLSFSLRKPVPKVRDALQVLLSAGLIDRTETGYCPHNWKGRQYISDSTERVKRHREKREAAGLEAQWQAPKALRQQIYARDKFACIYCGALDDLTLDHKTPELRGGTHAPENLCTACRKCNASKRDLTYEEFVARRVTNPVTSSYPEQNRTEDRSEQKQKDTCGAASRPPAVLGPEFIGLPTNRFESQGEEVTLYETFVEEMQRLYPAVDVRAELRAMRAWLITNTDKRKTRQGMKRFVTGWLSKTQNSPRETIRGNGHGQRARPASAHDKQNAGTLLYLESLGLNADGGGEREGGGDVDRPQLPLLAS